MDKKGLLKELQADWKKYWDIPFLKENNFIRKCCKNCGKYFWTIDKEQELCNDSSCRPYEFIGNSMTKKKFDYFQSWDAIQKFYIKKGHHPHERYPVLCKWFSPLTFTIAGVVDFYRMTGDKFTFELPANPVILLQPCLRFNDLMNVGITGRHWTCHSHVEQSSLYTGKEGYWKNECIRYNYELLTEVFGIKPDKINFIEDAWLGSGAFGYCLEYHVAGIELGNQVFTEFQGTPDNYTKFKHPLIDMGAGLERFCWFSQGTPTSYDAVYGSLIDKMRKKTGVEYDKELFLKYAKLSGSLNIDEANNIEKIKEQLAMSFRLSKAELNKKIEPVQSIYVIADHVKALLFAIADGGLPSNVGGGYNLRVILRRSLGLISKHNFDLDLNWTAEKIAEFFKPMHPELIDALPNFNEIIDVEEKRYKNSLERAKSIVANILNKERINEEKMVELYDSQGITPELIKEAAAEKGIDIEIPSDIYIKVTERHEKERKPKEEKEIDVSGIPETVKLFYENEKMFEFEAKVLKIIDGKYVALDKTAFYPRGGGQEPDFGSINGCRVYNVEKVKEVILHEVEDINFKEGDKVKGCLDKERRIQIMQHHTGAHLINAATRKILGPWVWQAGSKKDADKAHLDMTHYDSLTKEQVRKIEDLANKWIKENIGLVKNFMPRPQAEKAYGMRIYQGAAVPSEILRIVNTPRIDVEACGGTHVDFTGEIEKLIIIKTERPADGTIRVIYKAGNAAKMYIEENKKILEDISKELKSKDVPKAVEKLFEEWKEKKKQLERLREEYAKEKKTELKFEKIGKNEVLIAKIENAGASQLKEISLEMSKDNTVIILFGLEDKISIFGSAGKTTGINIGLLVKEIAEKLDGKGGGSPAVAQGVALNKKKIDEVIKWLKEKMK